MSPDAAIVMLSSGLLLVSWELNRPGLVLPGACGLLAVLLALAALQPAASGISAGCFAAAALLLLFSLRLRIPLALEGAAALALVAGFWSIDGFRQPSGGSRAHMAVAIACGSLLGFASIFLARIARRARRNKGLD